MRLSGETLKDIVERVNDLGYRRVLAKESPRQKKHQYMTAQKLDNLFADKISYGILEQSGMQIDLRELYEFEAMVTEEEFYKVQKKRKNY